MASQQNFAKIAPQCRESRSGVEDTWQSVPNLILGFPAELDSMFGNVFKNFQEPLRIAKARRFEQGEASAYNGKCGMGAARFPSPDTKGTSCRNRFVQQLGAESINGARMTKIDAHPVRRINSSAIFYPNPTSGGSGLQFIGQRIIIAPLPVMKKAARRGEKIERRLHVMASLRRPDIFRRRPSTRFFDLGNESDPPCHVVIAQPARRILEVGLQVEDRVAFFFVPLPCEIGKVA